MSEEFTYKFFGTTADGKRELVAMVNAKGMSEAIAIRAELNRTGPIYDYIRLEIERVPNILADGRGRFTP